MNAIYGKNFRIDNLYKGQGEPHLIINASVAKVDETGWGEYYVNQTVAIPLETVYEILAALGVKVCNQNKKDEKEV